MGRHEENICYIVINCDHNRRLFHRDSSLQDNGTFTISTLMMILVPHPTFQETQVIPLVCSNTPALIMKIPTVFPIYIINNDIEGNKYGVSILNHTTLCIHRNQVIQTKCIVRYCDCQIPHEMMNQGCGCWGTSGIGITNLYLLNNIVVDYRTSSFMMSNFSS